MCSILLFALPASANIAPTLSNSQHQEVTTADQPSLTLFAGEVAGASEGVLQLDKLALPAFIAAFLKVYYPQTTKLATAPNDFPASRGDCGLHTILTKGP